MPFAAIPTGKLRRYFSWENFVDPFKVIAGVCEAWRVLRKFKPDVVFSKGGFVSLPVVLAAAKLHVPVILHEADVEPGLANRMCMRFAKIICVSWEETMKILEKGSGTGNRSAAPHVAKKILYTGMPVRREILSGVREKGLEFLGFDGKRPILLVMGGSLGATSVNALVRSVLPELVRVYDVVHVTGMQPTETLEQKRDTERKQHSLRSRLHYRPFPYLQPELFDVYACTDVVVSRAGASALSELCVLAKPCVLIPLGAAQSRGDQIVNAEILASVGAAEVYMSEWNEPSKFVKMVCELGVNIKKRATLSDAMKPFGERHKRAAGQIAEVIMGI